MNPIIHIHLVPEEVPEGELGTIVDLGSEVHVIRFDNGMSSGKTAIGIGIQDVVDGQKLTFVVQVSMDSLRTMMAALEAAEEEATNG